MTKLLTIFLIIVGEAMAVLAEMSAVNHYEHQNGTSVGILLKFTLLFVLAGFCLVGGYMLGLKVFKNIWIVSTISLTTLLIVEPILAYTLVGHIPTKGALVGLGFGVLGMVSALVW